MILSMSCIDCEHFAKCGKCTRAWKKAWQEYPGKTQEAIHKRLSIMVLQYSICWEKQATLKNYKKGNGDIDVDH